MAESGLNRDQVKGLNKTMGDPSLQHRFNVEIDSVVVGGITNVEGLEFEHEIVEYHAGNDITTHARPGRQKQGRLKFRRDSTTSPEFFDWYKLTIAGTVARKNISVIMLADNGDESRRYNFFDCWVYKYKGPDFNSTSSANAVEAIEVCYERFELK